MNKYTVRVGTPDQHWSDDNGDEVYDIEASSPSEAMRKRLDAFEGEVVEVLVFGPPDPGVHMFMSFAVEAG